MLSIIYICVRNVGKCGTDALKKAIIQQKP